MDLEVDVLYEKWRDNLMKSCFLTAMVIMAAEILLLLEYYGAGEVVELGSYVLMRIICPGFMNCFALFVGYYIIRCTNVNSFIKNVVPVIVALWICIVVLFFHLNFAFGVTAFVIPVMLTIIYDNKSIMKFMITVSSIMIAAGFGVAVLRGYHKLEYYIYNYTVAVIIYVVGCIQANVQMRYEMDIKKILRKNISEKHSLQEKLRQDTLTGLYTFEAFREFMEQRVLESKKTIAVSVMCFDHKEAILENTLIQDFAQIIRTKNGLHGFGAYYGRGEFAMAFPGSSIQHAQDAVDDIRRALQRYPEAAEIGFELVSFTACISEYNMLNGETVEEMLDRLDQSLRKAQSIGGGRNIVV